MPAGQSEAEFGLSLAETLSPPRSGGLLAALHLWQRLLLVGPRQFGEVHYFGTLPWPDGRALARLPGREFKVASKRGSISIRSEGDLVGIEMQAAEDEDPCEIYFSDFRPVDGPPHAASLADSSRGRNVCRFADHELRVARTPPALRATPTRISPTTSAPCEFRFHHVRWQSIWLMRRSAHRSARASVRADDSLAAVARDVQPKMVKIYGAGGLRGLEAYQSGMLISAEGDVLTAWSYVLDSDDVAVVLDDGRRFTATLVGADPLTEVAVLKIDSGDGATAIFRPCTRHARSTSGRACLAFSNLFGIATGDEPVSMLQGYVSAVAPLEARRGGFSTNYRGDVYIVDAATNNPGASGGALVDGQGRLVGMLGKELRSELTGTWLNYALPVAAFASTVESIRAGDFTPRPLTDADRPDHPLSLAALGIVLVPDVVSRTPPYVDRVLPGFRGRKGRAAAGRSGRDDRHERRRVAPAGGFDHRAVRTRRDGARSLCSATKRCWSSRSRPPPVPSRRCRAGGEGVAPMRKPAIRRDVSSIAAACWLHPQSSGSRNLRSRSRRRKSPRFAPP